MLRSREIYIRVAGVDDIAVAAEIINVSFNDDPPVVWIVSDPIQRSKVMINYFKAYVKLGVEKGVVLLAYTPEEGLAGVAIWGPHDAANKEFATELESAIGAEYATKIRQLGDSLHAHCPPVDSYYQLMTMGVLPGAQGYGIGSALLAHRLRELDELGIPTYLEASTRRAAGGLFERFGFQPIGDLISTTKGVEHFPMWRPAPTPNPELQINKYIANKSYPIVGSILCFGRYNWRVLDVQGGRVLLLSDKILERRKFHEEFCSITWKDSSIRKYLNENFYNTFDESEQDRIAEIRISNYNNPWFGIEGGEPTNDKIFLLSLEEVVNYFGDSRQLRGKNPITRYYIDDHFNSARKALDENGSEAWWWLRTIGNNIGLAVAVISDGRITVSGEFVNRGIEFDRGMRPALWLNL